MMRRAKVLTIHLLPIQTSASISFLLDGIEAQGSMKKASPSAAEFYWNSERSEDFIQGRLHLVQFFLLSFFFFFKALVYL